MLCTPVWSYILELQTEKMILKKQHKPKCNVRYYVRVQTLKVCEVLALFSTLTIKTMEFNSIIVLFPQFQRLWSKHNRMLRCRSYNTFTMRCEFPQYVTLALNRLNSKLLGLWITTLELSLQKRQLCLSS